jgi:hypothetical protein
LKLVRNPQTISGYRGKGSSSTEVGGDEGVQERLRAGSKGVAFRGADAVTDPLQMWDAARTIPVKEIGAGTSVVTARVCDRVDARTVVGPAVDRRLVLDRDEILCGAEIYAEQSPQTCALSAVDQNFLHII